VDPARPGLGRDKGTVPLPGPLDLTMVHNYGMSFGLLRDHDEWGRWLLIGFLDPGRRRPVDLGAQGHKLLPAVGLGMIIGAAIGNNLIDRVIYGYVVDFIDVRDLHFPWVFNVADSGINIGVALLLIDSFLSGEEETGPPDRLNAVIA
jgi:signal peptidase II